MIHDWLTVYTGAEKVTEQILSLYPEATVFSLVDFLPESQRAFLQGKKPVTTFIQRLPFARQKYRQYIGLMPLAVEQIDLPGYDLILSSSHAVAKGVLTGPDQLHVAYIHSPLRYAWDLQAHYLREAGLERGIKSVLARLLLHYLRLWDVRTSSGVDLFCANSHFIARRIRKVYGREAKVIHPPVDVNFFSLSEEQGEDYLAVSRLVQYKKMEAIVHAFSGMPDKKLCVIGDGPEYERIQSSAGNNIEMMGYQPAEVIRKKMQACKALVFAAKEDFGIVPVEAQACGRPVIAYGEGGVLESVRNFDQPDPTGLFFYEQSVEAIQQAVRRFEDVSHLFLPQTCRENSLRFSTDRFRMEYAHTVESAWENFIKQKELNNC